MASRILESLGRFLGISGAPGTAAAPKQRLVSDNGLEFAVEQLKRGGMGIVYICRFRSSASEDSSQRVALKTFDEKFFFNIDMAGVLRREIAIWSQLSGIPYVFPLISITEIDKKPYMLMPVAEPDENGVVSLADAVRRAASGLPARECLAAALCIAFAMAEAGKRIPGVVHGDIKPDNVLFLRGWPFLSDFGLAGLAHERGGRGTPPYMAPELWSDKGYQTPRSDIYAYGATIAELLSGRPPFQAAKDDRRRWAKLHCKAPARIDRRSSADDAELTQQLSSLALRCLAKNAEERPVDFQSILESLLGWGLASKPDLVLDFMGTSAVMTEESAEQQPRFASHRIRALLEQGEIEAALAILRQIPEDKLQGELLMTAGSVWSLAGDDNKALEYFDRFLAKAPEGKTRTGCLNERGLSLRRLGKLAEAKALYESLLTKSGEDRELITMLRGNYAGVLLDLDEVADARQELQWLLGKNPDSPETRALYAVALQRSGNLAEAVEMLQRAIALKPRHGDYHVMRADLLMQLGRVHDALAALDAAYNLGYHSLQWLSLTLLASLLLDRKDAVENLLKVAKGNLSPEQLEFMNAEVQARFKEMAAAMTGDAKSGSETAPVVTAETKRGSTPADSKAAQLPPGEDTPPAPRREFSDEEYRQAVRSGDAAHVQVRMSYIDNSFSIDFYSKADAPRFVERFKESYQQIKWRFETQGGSKRQARYRFARCQSCAFAVLTARDEGERFECQVCREKGPVVTIRSAELDALATACEQAIGRDIAETAPPDAMLFVGFWLNDAQQSEAVSRQLREAGFHPAAPEAPAFVLFAEQLRQRHPSSEGPPTQIWHRPVTDADEAAQGQVPRNLEVLLRKLRRDVGHFVSISTQVDKEQGEFLLSAAEDRLRLYKTQVETRPDDLGLKRLLVSEELAVGHLNAARRIAAEMEITEPEDVEALIAAAEVALASERPQEAIPRLEKVIAAEPRNQTARIRLMTAYQLLNNSEKFAEHASAFEVLGGVLPR